MPDDPKPKPVVQKVQEGQQFKELHGSQQRSQQPSTSKSQLGDASDQNPFASNINVVADTPQAAAPTPTATSDSAQPPATPSDSAPTSEPQDS